MKNPTLKSVLYLFFITALLLGGCKGDPGDPGPAGKDGTNGTNGTNGKDGLDGTNGTNGTNGKDGTNGTNGKDGTNGTNGTNGTDGTNGTNGTNGVGFDDAIKYGNISVNLQGTRPDGLPFTKALNFKFASSNVEGSKAYVYDNLETNNNEREFTLTRFLTFDNTDTWTYYYGDYEYQGENANATDGSVGVYYDLGHFDNNDGTEYDYTTFSLHLRASITTNDFKYFNMNDTYRFSDPDGNETTNFNDLAITNYSYSPTTGKVKFSFSGTVDDYYNSTGYPLTISGEVNATVFQDISYRGRMTSGRMASGRRALQRVTKATMYDLPH